MARVALVSGGTRGIGAAISEALLKAGYRVAATYAENNTAAEAFRAKTGVTVYRWDGGRPPVDSGLGNGIRWPWSTRRSPAFSRMWACLRQRALHKVLQWRAPMPSATGSAG